MAVQQTIQKCELCFLEFKNGDQLKQHLDGKRHKKIESIKEERVRSAKRSLFVSGLRKDIFSKHLEEYFSGFGKISKVIVDQAKNEFAIIEFDDETSVDKAIEFKGEHKIHDKKLKVNRRQLKEFVTRIGNNGEKKKDLLEKNKEEALLVNTILGKCESFDDQIEKLIHYLKISADELKIRQELCQKLQEAFERFWSKNEIQIKIFGSTENGLACKGSDMDLTLLIDDYLKENRQKQQRLPKIVVKQLNKQNSKTPSNDGSVQNSSDSNLTAEPIEVELDEDIDFDQVNENEEKNDFTLKESVVKFFNDKDYKSYIKFDIEHQIKIAARIIQRFLPDLKHLKTIINTRCPVVNFHHEKANVNCDVSLNNFLAVENTKLIKLYMALEPNLETMIFVLRYWFKHKNLYASSKFNSYTIIWLIIFYMQYNRISNLPTLECLADMTTNEKQIHGWNCAFEDDIKKINSFNSKTDLTAQQNQRTEFSKQINSSSLNDLLKGFFDFYSKFQFTSANNMILSTRKAEIISTPEKEQLSKITSIINIQDPFDLSHNLSANVSKNTLEKFVAECKGSSEILQYSVLPRKSSTKCWGLMLLMTKKALPSSSPTSTAKHTSNMKELVEKSLFKLKLDDSSLSEQQNNKEPNEFKVKKAIDFVIFLLKNCLMFEQLEGDKLITIKRKRLLILNKICDQVDSLGLNCSPKRQKTSVNTSNDPKNPSNTYVCVLDENNLNNNLNPAEMDVENMDNEEKDEAKLIVRYQFNANSNTWQGRRAIKREIKKQHPEITNEIELEKLTSQSLIKNKTSKTSFKPINFKIDFINDDIDNSKSITNASMLKIKFGFLDEIDNQNDLIEFTTLVHFLDVYINNCKEKLYNQWIGTHCA